VAHQQVPLRNISVQLNSFKNQVNQKVYNLAKLIPNDLGKKRSIPTLTVRGFKTYCANKVNDVEQRFDWRNALTDAAIISSVTFFSTLAGGTVAGINTVHSVETATVAAFSQFFVFLALKRGLIQSKVPQ